MVIFRDTGGDTVLVVDFVNTLDLTPFREELDSPEALEQWFVERALVEPGYRATERDLGEAIELREALRTLLAAKNGVPGDVAGAAAVLDSVARDSDLAVRFTPDGLRIEPCLDACGGALGRILAAVATAMADGTWTRMKGCRAEDCKWAFIDEARNQSRVWCSMSSCGNRHKAREYRARHAAS
jgi:predicted RNA-binding Zn ribbon-like protein